MDALKGLLNKSYKYYQKRSNLLDISSNEEMSFMDNPQLSDPLQRVFFYLGLKDLYMLACVSQKFNDDIETYCKMMCIRFALENQLVTFVGQQLMIKDDEITLESKLKEGKYSFKWLFAVYTKFSRLRRISVSKCAVCWLGDERYIIINYNADLKREIVNLKTVCWLDIKKTFSNVKPGSYKVGMRMDIENGSWPGYNETGTKIFVQWEDSDGSHERKVQLTETKWKQLRTALKKLKNGNSIKVNEVCLTNHDSRNGWFDFALQEFTTVSDCDVNFVLSDCNGRWKSGIRWDYIELKPIDWYN